ncbi:MAG: carbohydrate kinase family protein [Caldilineae bacterium]|nr:MAG: carbohydrate kinase family protein [Caldilineae bacterium]
MDAAGSSSPPEYLFAGNLVLDDLVFANGETRMAAPGGNSLYAAVGARIWGAPVGLAAVVGEDWPDDYTRRLQEGGIHTAGLKRVTGETLRSWVLYEQDGFRRYVSRNREVIPLTPSPYSSIPPTPEEMAAFGRAAKQVHHRMSPRPEHLPPVCRRARALHLCPMPLDILRDWSRLPAAQKTADILPYPAAGNLDAPPLCDLLSRLDAFLPSQAEAEHLQPGYAPETLCRALAQRGPAVVVIKEGGRGVVVYHRPDDHLQRIPPLPVRVVDPTGAGDAFCGGFAVGLARTGDPFRAACYGTVSASFVIQDFGALHALRVSPTEAEARLAELTAPL